MSKYKKFIILITALCVFYLSAGINISFGYYDLLIQKKLLYIEIGSWQNDAMAYLNQKNPTMENDNGQVTNILKYVAGLIWKDIVYDNQGKISDGNLRTEFEGFGNGKLKQEIDVICDYIYSFLKTDNNGEIYYPDKNQVQSIDLNFSTVLEPGEYEDILSVFLTANLTEGYWQPVAYTVTLEGSENISDFGVELLYSPPENQSNMFGYQYRIIDNMLYNPTITDDRVNKTDCNLLPLISEYRYEIPVKNYISGNIYDDELITHVCGKPDFGNWNRFIMGPNIGVGKLIKNRNQQYEQSLEQLSPKTKAGLKLTGKPNGKITEMRLSVFDRGDWNKASFDIMPVIIRISRGVSSSGNSNNEIIPKITLKANKGDVWY